MTEVHDNQKKSEPTEKDREDERIEQIADEAANRANETEIKYDEKRDIFTK
jgi:hypothetical protein